MINYKYKKFPSISYQTYLMKIINFNKIYDNEINDFTFNNFKKHPQILVIGTKEDKIEKIIKIITKKIEKSINTTIYSAKNTQYKLKLKNAGNSDFNKLTIEQILASQMYVSDELYSNKWQNFDTCINIFDKCFSESEYNIMYKNEFEKLYKYSASYKIINITIVNYMYNDFEINKFDYVFFTGEKHKLNIYRISKMCEVSLTEFTDIFNKYSNIDGVLVITKENKQIEKIKFCEYDDETKQKTNIDQLICGNDMYSSKEEIKYIEI